MSQGSGGGRTPVTRIAEEQPGGAIGGEGRHTGLTAAEVAERVARGEVNDVPVRASRSVGEIIRGNVFTLFNAIMGVLFAVILVVGPLKDGLFGFVVLFNALIGIIQELRAKKTLDSLAVIGESRPTVRRDGQSHEVATGDIVLGDLIELGPGDKVVVDGVVTESDGLEIDESLLTGEADPVVKQPGDTVMSGSFVVAGGGAFTATKVGRQAYAAQLAEEASRFTLVNSELRNGIAKILKFCIALMIPASIGLVLSQLLVQRADTFEAIRRTVAGIVVMVPEGLVLITSVAFAIGVIRLGRKQCLVQELPAIEGLARVDVVCLDKTGTLTEGGMDVTDLRVLDSGSGEPYVRQVLAALGASDPRPNASLAAIIDAYPADGAEGWRHGETLPFSSARKYSGAELTEPDGTRRTWLLGAPDVLLPPGHTQLGAVDELNTQGLRVLLLARADGPLEDVRASAAPEALTPAALVILEQRLRPEAPDTLRYFAEQGVDAKVISGDNAVSVGAVAGKLGLRGAESPVDARELPQDQQRMAEAVEDGAVFGRVSPQQKREMVGALQSKGHNVAMTGDGVNDVLALKDADIGVSMGSGSEATRAVAQIVLLNNSFATLPDVVAEGRRVIGNIERVANLFLTKTVYSVFLAFAVIATQVPYPFLPRHSTLLSALTIGTPAFFLALAPNKERARPYFVRRVLRLAIPFGILAGAATFGTYLLARAHYGATDATREAETTAATLTLFLIALWVLTIIARPLSWWRVGLIATMFTGFVLAISIPFTQDFFELQLVGTQMPLTAIGMAVAAGVIMEIAARIAPKKVPDLPKSVTEQQQEQDREKAGQTA
ncbi:HAD-IC family P-type ATPase [Streptomyces harbinensis]|uniref:Cation-transporting ATPase E n=1 Tax=Streptomyces harbinensis TaxID=1176198 RepID=A0A1I6NYD5_9ACTN|nr:HAD-IC family P-type ATPase [Streptomyces harbinensis]SFS32976.1 cation-transporting ATPase E [Streptomyces harbinensis]